jgi:hypothetical protein
LSLVVVLGVPLPADSAGPVKKAPAEAQTTTAPPARTASKALMDLKETAFEFGTIMEGQSAEHVFQITNTGQEDLVIASVKPGCGCTVAKFDKVIAPGGTGKIVLTLDSRKMHGPFIKTATVQSNDSVRPNLSLKITGKVLRYVEVQPERVFLRGYMEDRPKASVKITSNLPEPLVIKLVNAKELTGKTDYELKTLQEGKEYQLDLVNTANVGRYNGKLVLQTNAAQKPTIEIKVYADISGDIGFYPNTVEMGRLSAGTKGNVGQVITFWKNRGDDFKLGNVTYNQKRFEVEVRQQGTRHMVYVRPRMEGFKLGEFRDEIRIETTSPDLPEVVVPIHGWIQ